MLKNPANRHKGVELTPEQFHYAFTNTLNQRKSRRPPTTCTWSRPPAWVVFQGGLANLTPHGSTTFDFSNDDRAPLLFVSGSDHILPPAIQREG